MLWMLVGLAGCGAVGIRLYTLQGRPQIWWLSFTLALVGIVVGSALLVDEAGVNATLGVANVAYLLSNLAFVVAGGAVTIFVHTLRRERPSPALMTIHAAGAVLVAVAITVGWVLAPIHGVSAPRFRDLPPYPQAWAYDWMLHLYFLPVLANVVVNSVQLLRKTGPDDPARRVGTLLTAGACSVDIAAHLLYMTRLVLRPRDPALAAQIGTAADVVTLVAVLGIAAGAVAFLLVPQLLALRRAHHLTSQLRPLWLRTREMHPSVALPRPRLIRHSPALQAERMLTEITDGLRLLTISRKADADNADPYEAVAEALRCAPEVGGPSASSALPVPASRLEEEEQVLTLARRFAGDTRAP